ncbi:MAG: dTMP kinase [Fibrobacter sp.]|nr:dTMP kinase [Fibrobacter sp.]
MQGKFITFEGIDGCGKSTQLALTSKLLAEKGFDVVVTREPGGTLISEKIREILLSPDNSEMVNECEILLYCAARAQHVREKIIPEVASGKIVLCDRFQEATFGYQGYGRGIPLDVLKTVNTYATGGLNPDLTFIFDLSVETSAVRMAKINKAKDRLEQNSAEFFQKIRDGFLNMAKSSPERIKLINAEQSIEQISEEVINLIQKHIK